MERGGRVLVVDDDEDVRASVVSLLKERHYDVFSAPDAFKAVGKLDQLAPDAIVTDLVLPGVDGIELLRRARKHDPNTIGIVMTAYGDVSTAVRAIREGASDFVVKPLDIDQLDAMLKREIAHRRMRLCGRPLSHGGLMNIIGESPAMRAIFDAVLQIASSRATVLITGESGTGKELVAGAVQRGAARAARAVRAAQLRCARRDDPRERAVRPRAGRVHGRDRASRWALPASRRRHAVPRRDRRAFAVAQVKLLRFLQEREFERVGGNETIKVDVRIVAATNRDLAALRCARTGFARTSITGSTW